MIQVNRAVRAAGAGCPTWVESYHLPAGQEADLFHEAVLKLVRVRIDLPVTDHDDAIAGAISILDGRAAEL